MAHERESRTSDPTRTDVSLVLPTSTVIADRFRLVERAGAGGMGTVYRAVDLFDGQSVALKLLGRLGTTSGARFEREAAVLAARAHPGIVRYVAHGETLARQRYLAMEWLEGETLKARLLRGPLSAHATAVVGRGILRALAAAHERGVVHRDIKPANLYLCGGELGRLKVLDFGIAQKTNDEQLTTPGAAIGTPAYMAPEQIRAAERADGRADIFSVGCVLFECLAGVPLFCGDSAMEVVAKICFEDASERAALIAGAPEPLRSLIMSMVARSVDARPRSAAELAVTFSSVIADLDQGAVVHELLAGGGSRRPLAGAEQRVVSLLAVKLGEGDRGDQLRGIEQQARAFGGWAEQNSGGRVVVQFGHPLLPSEEAARAARTALLIAGTVPGVTMALAMGRGGTGGIASSGDLIERATLLAQDAPDGAIVVDDASAAALESRFEVQGTARKRLLFEKGLKEAPRTVLGKETPCIGRDRELATLQGLYDECTSEPVARAVLMTSPAGAGKSRVLHELLERLQNRGEKFEYLVGRGDSLRSGAPLGLLGPALRASAGIAGAESPETQRKRLLAHVTRYLPPENATRIAVFLGEIAGIHFPDHDLPALHAARQDARLMADQMLAAWLDWLEAECAVHPVVLVLEDLHWGDAPSVQFVDCALRTLRDEPLLIVALARPEVDEKFPGLWSERDLQRICLSPLTRKSCTKLVQHVLEDLPAERIAWIVERADGNPFYLEELVRAAAGGADLPAGELPDTVIGMVQARFDTMGSEAKKVLRAASVFGQTFRSGGVKALVGEMGADIDEWLEILSQKEVLFSRPAGDTREFVFRHALIRDAAYELLAAPDRLAGHKRAGEWLENAGEREAIVLVEHFERGGELAQAAHWSRFAAEQALEANDLGAVIERVERGVRCGAEGEVLGLLRLVEAQARVWRGDHARAEVSAQDALTCVEKHSLRFRALTELVTALGQQAKYTRVEAHLGDWRESQPDDAEATNARHTFLVRAAGWLRVGGQDALSDEIIKHVAAHQDLPINVLARIEETRGMKARSAGKQALAIKHFREALRWYELCRDTRAASKLHGTIGFTLGELGVLEEAQSHLQHLLTISQKHNLEILTVGALLNLAPVLCYLGRPEEGRSAAEHALHMADRHGDKRFAGGAAIYLSECEWHLGRFPAAESAARMAVDSLAEIPPVLPFATATLARSLLSQNRLPEALALARRACDLADASQSLEDGEAAVRVVFVEALLASGFRAEAIKTLGIAKVRLMERAEAIGDLAWRASFLTRIPDHAKILALSRDLLRSGLGT